jgi:hypothetical protein
LLWNLWPELEECVVLVLDEVDELGGLLPHADTATAVAARTAISALDSRRRRAEMGRRGEAISRFNVPNVPGRSGG